MMEKLDYSSHIIVVIHIVLCHVVEHKNNLGVGVIACICGFLSLFRACTSIVIALMNKNFHCNNEYCHCDNEYFHCDNE